MADDRELLAERDGLMGQIVNEPDAVKRKLLEDRLEVVLKSLSPKPRAVQAPASKSKVVKKK